MAQSIGGATIKDGINRAKSYEILLPYQHLQRFQKEEVFCTLIVPQKLIRSPYCRMIRSESDILVEWDEEHQIQPESDLE